MRPFRVFKRENGIYYARAIDVETGNLSCTRSTGVRDKFQALMIVSKWLDKGIPVCFQKRSERRKGIVTAKTENVPVFQQMPLIEAIPDEQAITPFLSLQKRFGLGNSTTQNIEQPQVFYTLYAR